MRDLYSYYTNEIKESADDFINICQDVKEKKFIKWTYYLEDTITFIKLTYNLYDGLILSYFSDNDNKNIFKTVILSSLCRSIITSLSCILAKGKHNEYEISKYIDYIKKNVIIHHDSKMQGIRMKQYDDSIVNSMDCVIKDIEEEFKNNFSVIRNKMYAHSDNIYFNEKRLKDIFDKEDFSSIKRMYLVVIDILNKVWMMFHEKELSFEIENEKHHYIEMLKMFNIKNIDLIVDYLYENDNDD